MGPGLSKVGKKPLWGPGEGPWAPGLVKAAIIFREKTRIAMYILQVLVKFCLCINNLLLIIGLQFIRNTLFRFAKLR